MTRKKPAITTTQEDPLSVGHHSGDRIYGYNVWADGSIQLSPSCADRMNDLADRHRALLDMQDNLARFIAKDMADICAGYRRWWDDIKADLGDLTDQDWVFEGGHDRILVRRPKPVEPDAAA